MGIVGRFLSSYREEHTGEPGLIQKQDGSVWVVGAGGSEARLGVAPVVISKALVPGDIVRRAADDPYYEPEEGWDPDIDGWIPAVSLEAGQAVSLMAFVVAEEFDDSGIGTIVQLVDRQDAAPLNNGTVDRRTLTPLWASDIPGIFDTWTDTIFYCTEAQQLWWYFHSVELDATQGRIETKLVLWP